MSKNKTIVIYRTSDGHKTSYGIAPDFEQSRLRPANPNGPYAVTFFYRCDRRSFTGNSVPPGAEFLGAWSNRRGWWYHPANKPR